MLFGLHFLAELAADNSAMGREGVTTLLVSSSWEARNNYCDDCLPLAPDDSGLPDFPTQAFSQRRVWQKC